MNVAADLTLEQLSIDPYPALAALRANEPVAFVPSLDLWLVTRWDDVMAVTVDETRFISSTEPSWLNTVLGVNMLGSDGAEHRRLKDATQPAFAPRALSSWVGGRLPELCHELIDAFPADQPVDLMSAYAEPIAVIALADALGWSNAHWSDIGAWTKGVCAGLANFDNQPEPARLAAAANQASGDSIIEALGNLRACPVSSGLQGIVEHPNALTDDEIIANVRLMMSGGINEPRDGICLVAGALLSHPDQLRRCREQGLWRAAVEETMRWISPVGTATRQVAADTELAGVRLPQGSLVAGVLSSANRDEQRWTRADLFDIDRREGASLAFAHGAHVCLGAWLGRQTMRVAVEILFGRFPDLTLAAEPTLTGFEFRGPTELRLNTAPK